ncbi:MAG: radical SAM protein [Agathobacter sp.]
MKALVENDEDELFKLKYVTQARRFSNKVLALTINPTLDCNFACPYCFEKKHPKEYMNDEIEDDIINYIKRQKDANSISVTWFGGEPWLAFDRIMSLSHRMMNLGLSYEAGIISNGYLLTEEVAEALEKIKISRVQVTIDGLAYVHDKRRPLRGCHKGTFDVIMKNIDYLHMNYPNIRISIRVNIDKTNMYAFRDLKKFFNNNVYKGIVVSPAFVEDISSKGVCTLDTCQQFDFMDSLSENDTNNHFSYYPSKHRVECAIRNWNSILIGPKGELYKCWNDVGNKDKVYGNITGEVTNERLLLKYLMAEDPLNDKVCNDCILFPVCDGGCPYLRIFEKNKSHCPLIKMDIKQYLLKHYKNVKNQNL